jgi:hypothetical protein
MSGYSSCRPDRSGKLLLASVLALVVWSPASSAMAQDQTANPRDWRQPCLTPIKYRIGALDPRFGITREDFRRRVEQAGELWAGAAGRKLFSYDDEGALEIDLVYDSRQETTQHLLAARASISEKLKQADQIKSQLLPLRDQFRSLDASFSSGLSSYQRALAAYNQVVTNWNRQGGAPQEEQQRLLGDSALLRKQADSLNESRLELNRQADQINVLVSKHNALLDRANAEANALNKSASYGNEFEEGLYTRQGGETRIQIFEYEGETALVIILAHEMGHALGIRHNANAASIMSPLVHTREPVLTAEDLDGLKAACTLP